MAEQFLPPEPAPWHAGETRLQRRVGVAERMAIKGPHIIRDFLPEQHREFYALLPFVIFGGVDPSGDVWATLVAGRPGFATSPEPRVLAFEHALSPDDPATAGFAHGSPVGLLGIELHTRRRNRANGRIFRREAGLFQVAVEHAFGNCPRYIRLRDVSVIEGRQPGAVHYSSTVDERARAMIAGADTVFVASYTDDTAEGRQVDASHRGGKAGFVRIGEDGMLTIPDFAGNLHFNTLGNLLINPKAGLIFVDDASGDVLQMTGRAEVILDSPEIAAFQGAERLWTFKADKVVLREAALPLRWVPRADGRSPNSLTTGDWVAVSALSRG